MIVKHKQRKKKFQELWKEQQGTKCSNWKKIPEIWWKQEKQEISQTKKCNTFKKCKFQTMKAKRGFAENLESGESGEISASSSEWKMGSDKLFVTCLDVCDKIAKPIKNYWNLFINTSVNHTSIRSCLVSQPKKLKTK